MTFKNALKPSVYTATKKGQYLWCSKRSLSHYCSQQTVSGGRLRRLLGTCLGERGWLKRIRKILYLKVPLKIQKKSRQITKQTLAHLMLHCLPFPLASLLIQIINNLGINLSLHQIKKKLMLLLTGTSWVAYKTVLCFTANSVGFFKSLL